MRLVTYLKDNTSSIGVELDKGILDIPESAAKFGTEYDGHADRFPVSMIELLNWNKGIRTVLDIVETYKEEQSINLISEGVRFRAPISRPGKIIGIGLNYIDHIKELGESVPEYPEIFTKFPSSISHPNDEIPIPRVTKQLDWEIELGVVIGKLCKEVSDKNALEYVAGYTIINDLSARDFENRGGQWIHGKLLDGLCPMGPCIVTTDELGDGSGLKMQTKINDVIKQDSNTSNLLLNVPKIVSYLSQSFTLEPGDAISTGTPPGVGYARNPPEYLRDGDEMDLYIERIGHLRNTIVGTKDS